MSWLDRFDYLVENDLSLSFHSECICITSDNQEFKFKNLLHDEKNFFDSLVTQLKNKENIYDSVLSLKLSKKQIRMNLMVYRLFELLKQHPYRNTFLLADRANLSEIQEILQQLKDADVQFDQIHDAKGNTIGHYLINEQLANPWVSEILTKCKSLFGTLDLLIKNKKIKKDVKDVKDEKDEKDVKDEKDKKDEEYEGDETPFDRLISSEGLFIKNGTANFRDLVVRNNFFMFLQTFIRNGSSSNIPQANLQSDSKHDPQPFNLQSDSKHEPQIDRQVDSQFVKLRLFNPEFYVKHIFHMDKNADKTVDKTADYFKDALGSSRFKLFIQVLLGCCDKDYKFSESTLENIKATLNLNSSQVTQMLGKMKPCLGEGYDTELSTYKASRTSAIGFFSSMEGVSVLPLTFTQNILLPVIATTAFILLVPGVNMLGIGIAIAVATLYLVAGAMKYAQLIKGQEAEKNLYKLVDAMGMNKIPSDTDLTEHEIVPPACS